MKNATNEFVVKDYGRTELAKIYFPLINNESAWRKLKDKIEGDEVLSAQLHRLGYDGHHRWFTIAQVQAIVNRIGSPRPRFHHSVL